jgi:subtilisin-like proprotein convertase family protein
MGERGNSPALVGRFGGAAVVLAGLILSAAPPHPADARTKTTSFSAEGSFTFGTDVPVVSSLYLPKGRLKDVNVTLRLTYPRAHELGIWLLPPRSDTWPILLARGVGGAGADYGTGPDDCAGMPTVFDDEATTAVAQGTAPFSGSFRPYTPLSFVDGHGMAGRWWLVVDVMGAGSVGNVHCWGLDVTYKARKR